VGAAERYGVGPGELLAIDLPAGPAWIDLVRELWEEGIAFLPLDRRLADPERRALVDRARPAAVLDATGGTTLFGDAGRLSPGTAVVVATSGTEGAPKLVELSRSAVTAAVEASAEVLGATPADPWVACLTPAHVGGLLVYLRGAVLGAPLTALERFDPASVVGAGDGAFVSLVPTMVRRLLDEPGVDPAPLRCALVGGDAFEPALAAAAADRGLRCVPTYGLTESCGGVVYGATTLAGTGVRIAGGGRIELRGPTLMEGYLRDPQATAEAFTVDGWLRTRDAGELGADGSLAVLGRLDDAILTGGELVWPVEVEAVLRTHPEVADVLVVGRPHPDWGRQVTALVVPVLPADPPTLGELCDHAGRELADFKLPRALETVEVLPKTRSGKPLRSDFS
jgi:O-succinylbenzoic acid--CoA ligase